MRRRLTSRSGTILPLVALTLVILLVSAGATIEVGRLTLARNCMQKAADLAVTSAVSQIDAVEPPQVRQAAAEFYGANLSGDPDVPPASQVVSHIYGNNGEVSGLVCNIGTDRVTIRHPYQDAVTSAESLPPNCLLCLEAEREVELPFLAIVGVCTATVRVRAVGLGEPSGPCLFFAASTDPSVFGIDWSSNGGTIFGDAHSNTMVKFSGSDHTVDGWMDYRYSYTVTGSGHYLTKGFRLGNVMDYPINYTPADFEPYDYVYNNCNFNNHVIPAGVYYIAGNLHITGADVVLGPVTFVVAGRIQVSGTGHNFTAARNNVLFYSLSNSSRAIDVSAQGGQWTGICFAPNGHVSYSASDQHIYNGGIVAQTIEITGQDFTAHGMLPPLPRFFSRLVR